MILTEIDDPEITQELDIVIVEKSPGKGIPPKIEGPTDVPYIKLRNWSETWERYHYTFYPNSNPYLHRTDEPNYTYFDFQEYVAAATSNIDEEGIIRRTNFSTREDQVVGPIAPIDASKFSNRKRDRISTELAERLFALSSEVLAYYEVYSNRRQEEQVAAFKSLEGIAAELLAQYREDIPLLELIAAKAREIYESGAKPKPKRSS